MKLRFSSSCDLAVKRNVNVNAAHVAAQTHGNLGEPGHRYASRAALVAMVLVCATGVAGFPSTALAVKPDVYGTSFEQPVFLGGEQLLGTDGWSDAIPDFLNPMAAKITGAASRNDLQSVEVRGADLYQSDAEDHPTFPYDAIGSYRKPLNLDVTTPIVRIEADLLLDTNQPATPGEFFSLTIAARSGDGETLGEIGLSSQRGDPNGAALQGTVVAFPFDVAPGSAPAFSAPISFNRWHRIAMDLDYSTFTTTYYVDERPFGTIDMKTSSSNVSRASLVVYARPDGGTEGGKTSLRSNYTARFDNFRVFEVK